MIPQVQFKNFKCLRDVTVNLEPFTVFVGANGSGKTSILQGIDLLCRTFRKNEQTNSEYITNKSFGAIDEVVLSCQTQHYLLKYIAKKEIGIVQFKENKNAELWKSWVWTPENSLISPSTFWLRLDPNVLRNSQPGSDIRAMRHDGHGMHRAVSSMMLERRNDFFKLEADLTRIVPSVRQLQLTAEHEIRFDMINGKGLTAHQVSEGTLLTLGLLTAIHSEPKPGILLLDDLDRALHPKAQRELIDLLRGVQKTNPEIQIVASTHSPYLLGRMEPNEVQVTYLRDDGSTACEPITHHPKFEKWKEEFHPGEMWSMFGEKWVAEPEVVTR